MLIKIALPFKVLDGFGPLFSERVVVSRGHAALVGVLIDFPELVDQNRQLRTLPTHIILVTKFIVKN